MGTSERILRDRSEDTLVAAGDERSGSPMLPAMKGYRVLSMNFDIPPCWWWLTTPLLPAPFSILWLRRADVRVLSSGSSASRADITLIVDREPHRLHRHPHRQWIAGLDRRQRPDEGCQDLVTTIEVSIGTPGPIRTDERTTTGFEGRQ
jgi:hypothetical protein